jgi:hypothetical protein
VPVSGSGVIIETTADSNESWFRRAFEDMSQRLFQSICYGVDPAREGGGATSVVYVEWPDLQVPDEFSGVFSHAHEVREKSLELMKTWLTPKQLKQYEADGTFDVIGCDSKKRYRITDGRFSHGVHELDPRGKLVAKYCFVPEGAASAGDVMLAQKVALEHNEHAALKVANCHRVTWS